MPTYVRLTRGDPAPWFVQRSHANPRFVFNSTAGRYIVLCFFGSANDPHSQAALAAVRSRPAVFDDVNASFFGVSNDAADEREKRVGDQYPGYRQFWDFDGTISRLYGALPMEPDSEPLSVRRLWVILDPMLRVLDVVPFAGDRGDIDAVLGALDRLAPTNFFTGVKLQAPILFLPNVFEPTFCQSLIDLYERVGGQESGFMSEVDGRTVLVHNHHHKRRKDCTIEDDDIIRETQSRVLRRIVPMIQRAYQFKATRMERYIICCYEDKDGAHFRPHRDNTTKGTAHRRFAVSINLNADFEGGEICFPEFGQQTYKPPVGGAVVFSCSLLHAVTTVTRGRRYAFLPFLYDEEAARLREANAGFLESDGPAYKSGIGGT